MPANRQKGDMLMNRSKIEWCDHTWNPITGCRHDCKYCYARRMSARFAGDVRLNKMAKKDYLRMPAADGGKDLYELNAPMMNETGNPLVYPFGFEPTFHKYRMDIPQKLKMGNNIFVGAMSDVFGKWVRDAWIDEIMQVCKDNPIHNYLFLTKNPERYGQYGVPTGADNMWFGTTVTREAEIGRVIHLPMECKRFVSIEPLLEDIRPEEHQQFFKHVDWVIVGAETGRNKNKIVPQREWIMRIVLVADAAGIPVFMKNSLLSVVGEKNMRQEFPIQLQHVKMSPKMKKKLFDVCAECKDWLKKSDMITLLARSKRGERPKQFGFMCKGCFKKFCENLELKIPELEELEICITTKSEGNKDG